MSPLMVKSGRHELKRYVCVFTCLACSAIHLQLTYSLNAGSFLLALQHFINRRGRPAKIISVNGPSFVGAYQLLKEGLKSKDMNLICPKLSKRGID